VSTLAPPAVDVAIRAHAGGRWYRNVSLVTGLVIVVGVVGACAFAPLVTSHDPTAQDLLHPLQPPGAGHLLGTDQLGKDVWANLLYGGRADLLTAVLAALFPFVIGTVLGALAGYFGRWVDVVVSRAIDVVVAFPFYVLVIALVFLLRPGIRSIVVAITLVGWVSYARIVRGEVLVAKRQEYVLAARAGGLSNRRILIRHLGPNVVTQAIVFSMSDIVLNLLAIVTLGYLGLGVPPPDPDWGRMIYDGQQFITTHWLLATVPGLAVVLTGIGLALIGDGLADLLRVE
jgi:peptide/nickel transport system permease protein